MRIVLISNLFPPYVRGGAELVAAASAKALQARGHDVTVITTCPAKAGPKRYQVENDVWEGVRVLRFFPQELYFTLDDHKHKYSTRFLWHIQDAFNMYSAGVVRKILKKEKPDLVITHNLKGIGLLIPSVIRELKLKHAHTLHDVQLLEPSGLILPKQAPVKAMARAKAWLKNIPFAMYRFTTRVLFNSPALIISPTEWLLNLHRAEGFFPKSHALVLQNPVREIAREVHSESDPRIRFVFVGQIETHKGIVELIDAWIDAEHDGAFTAELDVVGDGTLMDAMREKVGVHEHIRFHGRLPNDKVMHLLSDATALVFPSKCMENAPGAVLESLAVGTPVIASEVGGVPEFVKENQSGWIVQPGDIAELSRMLRHVASHPKEVQMLRQALSTREPMTADKYAESIEKA
jgi:glycosyltransferase involved in cell wall biosynthesis